MSSQFPEGSYQSPPAKRLARSKDDRWISGVCGGVARYANIDANLVRLLVVLGTLFGFGSLLVVYVVAWIVMPED